MDSATAITTITAEASIAAVASIASEAADIIIIIFFARGTIIACTRRDIYDSTVLVVVVMIALGIFKVCVVNGNRWIFTGVRLSIPWCHLKSSFNYRLLTHEVSKDEADCEGLFVVKHVSFLSFCDRYL